MRKEISFPYMEVGVVAAVLLPIVVTVFTRNYELGLHVGEAEIALFLLGVFLMGEKRP